MPDAAEAANPTGSTMPDGEGARVAAGLADWHSETLPRGLRRLGLAAEDTTAKARNPARHPVPRLPARWAERVKTPVCIAPGAIRDTGRRPPTEAEPAPPIYTGIRTPPRGRYRAAMLMT